MNAQISKKIYAKPQLITAGDATVATLGFGWWGRDWFFGRSRGHW